MGYECDEHLFITVAASGPSARLRWRLCLFKKADAHVDNTTDKLSTVASLIKNEKPMSFKTASGCSHLQDD